MQGGVEIDQGNNEVSIGENLCGLRNGNACGVDGGELVAELNIAGRIHADVARAGADDFVAGAEVFEKAGAFVVDNEIAISIKHGVAVAIQDIGCFINLRQVNPQAVCSYAKLACDGDRLVVGSITGVGFGRVKFPHKNRASFTGQAGGWKQRFRRCGCQVGSCRDGVGPGLNVCWKIGVDCLQLTHPQSGVAVRIVAETVSEDRWIIGCYGSEPVAQGVVENDIPRGAEGQEAGGIFAAVAHLGEIPIGGAFAFDVIDTRRVGEAQNQVAGSVDDFDARSENEIGRSRNTKESGDDVIFIVHEIGSIRVDLIAEGNVHDAAVVGDVVKFVALNHDGGGAIGGAGNRVDLDGGIRARGAKMNHSLEFSFKRTAAGIVVVARDIRYHREIK